ncbi:hypothetical protein QBZ16_001664 [Prototheca wickerhamii]|uniref:Uncharacterized protein n=1 Tax=Prototheca wickerhamii TaxID=3111 RepID=A0AAD9MLK3_PROWI|nr:hypothetical protein QBZ16_001664 [Prototheca wickerhamii]
MWGKVEGTRPDECSSGLFSGNEWDHDEIECHFCDAQLKCEHEGGTIRSEKIDCEYDPGVLDREVDFECPITNGKADCDWNDVLGKLPGECGGWVCLGRRCGVIGCTGL